MVIVYCDGGIGNRIICLANGIWLADFLSSNYVVVWPINEYCGASLSDVLAIRVSELDMGKSEVRHNFKVDLTVTDCENFLGLPPDRVVNPTVYPTTRKFFFRVQNFHGSLDNLLVFSPRIFNFAYFSVRGVISRLDASVAVSLILRSKIEALSSSHRFLASHFRGTDGYNKRSLFFLRFYLVICRLLGAKILLFTDDRRIRYVFRCNKIVELPACFHLPSKRHSGRSWSHAAVDSNEQRLPYNVSRSRMVIIEAMADIELMRQFFILPTSTSTFMEVSVCRSSRSNLSNAFFGFVAKVRMIRSVLIPSLLGKI